LAAAAVAAPGKIVAQRSASGIVAATAVTASVSHPKNLWVRLTGDVRAGQAAVSCTKTFTVSTNTYRYSHAGTYRVAIKPAGADTCILVASVQGTGKIGIEIRT
jgi:hypothetical protein